MPRNTDHTCRVVYVRKHSEQCQAKNAESVLTLAGSFGADFMQDTANDALHFHDSYDS